MKSYLKFILLLVSIFGYSQANYELITSLNDNSFENFARPNAIVGFVQKGNLIAVSSICKRTTGFTNQVVLYTLNGVNVKQISVLGSYGSRNSQFNYPTGLVIDDKNRLFVADKNNHRIQMFSLIGTNFSYMSQIGNLGSLSGQFLLPKDIAILDSNLLAVSDIGLHKIKIISIDGNNLIEVNSFGGYGITDGGFNEPTAMTKDKNSKLYVIDKENHRIQILSINGTTLSYHSKIDETFHDSLDFSKISDICISSTEGLYISNEIANKIFIITSIGDNMGYKFSKKISNPTFIECSSQNLYVLEAFLNIFCQYANDKLSIYEEWNDFKKIGSKFFYSEGGQLSGIISITTSDEDDRLFVADYYNNSIKTYSMVGTNFYFLNEFYLDQINKNIGVIKMIYHNNYIFAIDDNFATLNILSVSGNGLTHVSSLSGLTGIRSIAMHKNTGNIYASCNNNIYLLTQNGINLGIKTVLGVSGTLTGQLNRPSIISISNNSLYVLNDYLTLFTHTDIQQYKIGDNNISYQATYSNYKNGSSNWLINDIATYDSTNVYLCIGSNPFYVRNLIAEKFDNELFLYLGDTLGNFYNTNYEDYSGFSTAPIAIHVDNKNRIYIANGSRQIDVYKKKSSLTAINDPKSKSQMDFTIYPNPTNSTFTISAVGNQNIQITNAIGKEVYTNYNYIPQTEIDLSQEPTGIYFVKVGTTVKKLLLR